jgi:hypothetical protein
MMSAQLLYYTLNTSYLSPDTHHMKKFQTKAACLNHVHLPRYVQIICTKINHFGEKARAEFHEKKGLYSAYKN